MMRPLTKCCFCEKPIIGMDGYDFVLDTYYLLDEQADKAIIDNKKFGDCHICCLEKSSYSNTWHKRIIRNLIDVRKFNILFRNDDLLLLENNILGKKYVHILSTEYMRLHLPVREILKDSILSINDTIEFSIITNIEDHSIIRSLNQSYENKSDFGLLLFFDFIGIKHDFYLFKSGKVLIDSIDHLNNNKMHIRFKLCILHHIPESISRIIIENQLLR